MPNSVLEGYTSEDELGDYPPPCGRCRPSAGTPARSQKTNASAACGALEGLADIIMITVGFVGFVATLVLLVTVPGGAILSLGQTAVNTASHMVVTISIERAMLALLNGGAFGLIAFALTGGEKLFSFLVASLLFYVTASGTE